MPMECERRSHVEPPCLLSIGAPTRRIALGMLAGAPLVGLPAIAAAAPTPDAELIRLWKEWKRLDDLAFAVSDIQDPLEIEFDRLRPEYPVALTFHVFNDRFGVGWVEQQMPNGRCRTVYGAAEVEQLRIMPSMTDTRWDMDEAGEPIPHEVPDPKREERRQAIIAAYDAWEAKRSAIADRLGLTAVRARAKNLADARNDVEARMMTTPAKTLAGIMAKANLAASLADFDHAWSVIDDLLAIERETV